MDNVRRTLQIKAKASGGKKAARMDGPNASNTRQFALLDTIAKRFKPTTAPAAAAGQSKRSGGSGGSGSRGPAAATVAGSGSSVGGTIVISGLSRNLADGDYHEIVPVGKSITQFDWCVIGQRHMGSVI
jgi:hypothetical protein